MRTSLPEGVVVVERLDISGMIPVSYRVETDRIPISPAKAGVQIEPTSARQIGESASRIT